MLPPAMSEQTRTTARRPRSSAQPSTVSSTAVASMRHEPAAGGRLMPHELPELAELRRFELRLQALCTAVRMLPALTPDNAASERSRLIGCLERGEPPVPNWHSRITRVPSAAFRLIDELRPITERLPSPALYRAKLDELELDLLLLDVLGKPRLVRPLAARRYGTGAALAPTDAGSLALSLCARKILDTTPVSSEAREIAADGEPESLASMVHALAKRAGLEVRVRIDPRLSAGAATGERTVFLAARRFGRMEARRFAVHEVLGHLLSAANGRAQPVRLLDWGTANSFADQEGLALYMEELAGVLDGSRLRTLAGRVLAADLMHGGASFAETARRLLRQEGFSSAEAIAISERAYRGGGVARDVSYLLGWLRVRRAVTSDAATLDELHNGRVSLEALPELRRLQQLGYVREPLFTSPAPLLADLPNFARSFFSTKSGTIPRRSPPSEAASLIKLELTKK
jgi:uncharacterized protein (TIGR02421 family)